MAADALVANNPDATFTLIRAYAENAAATDTPLRSPKAINKLMGMDGSSLSIAADRGEHDEILMHFEQDASDGG